MLRPRTALRIVLYTAATWLVLGGLYVGLPSFSRDDDGIQYATKVLTSGGTLTRVYGVYDGFYVGGAAEFTNHNESRTNIALTFRVDNASNSLFICSTNRIDLTRAPDPLHPDEIFSMEPVAAPAGDIDGISLEWFDTADAVLMYHWIHGDKALVSLDVAYSEGGRQLNIWPAGASNREEKLLFSVTVNDTPESNVLIARVPRSPLSISPSPIYHVRLALLTLVAPLTILLMGALMGLRFIISTVFSLLFRLFCIISGILLAAWLYEGRPPVKEYEEKVMNDLRGLVGRVQHWRNVKNEKSPNRGKDDEHSSTSKDEESSLSLTGAAKDVS